MLKILFRSVVADSKYQIHVGFGGYVTWCLTECIGRMRSRLFIICTNKCIYIYIYMCVCVCVIM